MKTIFDETGTGKELQARFAKLQKKSRKATDPAAKAMAAIAASFGKVDADDRVHLVLTVAEHDAEPLFKADLSITSAARSA